MSPNRNPTASVLCRLKFLLLLPNIYGIHGTGTDVLCLRSIYDSLEDPNGYLNSTWNFNNHTESAICAFNGIECSLFPEQNSVQNIKLADMGLRGHFPLGIEHCTSLTGLDLSGNNLNGPLPWNISKYIGSLMQLNLADNAFSGPIPENLANCSSLSDLNLEHNQFSGQLTRELGSLVLLERFSVDNNNLWGPIPKSLANCTYLSDLNLDHNQFSGQIPLGFGHLSYLKSFSVANNNLWGPVPNFSNPVLVSKDCYYVNNSGLCGGPLEACPTWFNLSGFAIVMLAFAVVGLVTIIKVWEVLIRGLVVLVLRFSSQ